MDGLQGSDYLYLYTKQNYKVHLLNECFGCWTVGWERIRQQTGYVNTKAFKDSGVSGPITNDGGGCVLIAK